MNLDDARRVIEVAEPRLADAPFVIAHVFQRDGKSLAVGLTERLRRACRKGHVWKSKEMLTAFKNAEYGFDPRHAHSPGGSDGIFLLSREFVPKNQMMTKVFDRFLDKHGSGAEAIAEALGASVGDLKPVRLVSHHLRLLGVLHVSKGADTLVLVDYDDAK